MLTKYNLLEDSWEIYDTSVSGDRVPHIAGVYRVYSGNYYCSLILDPVYRVPEFMAFKWNVHAEKVTNWMEVFSFNPVHNCNDGVAGIDVETFQECMNKFYDFLIQEEAKGNDD